MAELIIATDYTDDRRRPRSCRHLHLGALDVTDCNHTPRGVRLASLTRGSTSPEMSADDDAIVVHEGQEWIEKGHDWERAPSTPPMVRDSALP